MMLIFRCWQFLIGLYFRNIQVHSEKGLPEGVPIIFVANHANAFVDPFILSTAVKKPLRLTMKATLMKNPFLWLLSKMFHAIPLVRKEDEDGQASRKKNVVALQECRRALKSGSSICIFPEGKSHSEPQLLPFKTGAARIALDFVDEGKVMIVPVGIYYESKSEFGSRIVVQVGAALDVSAWKKTNSGAAEYKALTHEIEKRVKSLTLEFEQNRDSEMLIWASQLYQNSGMNPLPVDHADVLPVDFVPITQRITKGYYALKGKPEVKAVEYKTELLRRKIYRSGLNVADLFLPMDRGKASFFVFRETEMLLIGAVFFMVGLLLHFAPIFVLFLIVPRISKDRDHWATNYLFIGIGLWIFYCLAATLLVFLVKPVWALAVPPILFYFAYFSILFSQRSARTLHRLKTFSLFLLNSELKDKFESEANEIIQMIQKIKEKYLIPEGP